MQIVIEIDEYTYKDIKNGKAYSSYRDVPQESILAIADGTPLPKGHGRLIDGDKLFSDMENGIYAGLYEEGYEHYGHILNMDDCLDEVKAADTIIPADKEESE